MINMTKVNFGLKIGDVCRLKSSNNYAKIREIGYFGKTHKIARCKWTQENPDKVEVLFGLIKYFKLSELKKIN